MSKTPKKRAAAKASVQPITITPVDKYAALDATAASKLDLSNLDLSERAFLGTCQDMYRNDRGCVSPFEEFFCLLAQQAAWGNTPTPETIREELEGFESDWELTLHSVKRFIQNYPDLLSSMQTPAEEPQQSAAAHA